MNIEYVYLIILGVKTFFERGHKNVKIEVSSSHAKIIAENLQLDDTSIWNVGNESKN